MPASEVRRATAPALLVGEIAYVRVADRVVWLPVTLEVIDDTRVRVTGDAVHGCAAEFGKPTQWVERDRLIALKPLETPS